LHDFQDESRLRTLTVKLRGRAQVPDWSRGCTLSSRTRGDTTDSHGPLQRLLDGASEGGSLVVLRRIITSGLSRLTPQRCPEVRNASGNENHGQRYRKIPLRPVRGATEQTPSASAKQPRAAREHEGTEYAVPHNEGASEGA